MSVWHHSLVLALGVTAAAAQEAPAATETSCREAIDKGRDKLAERLFGLKLSAFGDVVAAPGEDGRKKVDWGSFELDLAAEFHDYVDAAAAFVWTREGTSLATGFLDFHPFGGSIAPRGRLWVEKGFHIQVGRFDVPFGNDWQFFASKDSVSISRPLTTDGIMDGGYNDEGLRLLGNDGTFNFNTFLLRGFSGGRLAGGRLGCTPFGNPFSLQESREPKSAEFGLSYLYDTRAGRQKQETAWALDAEGRIGSWFLRAEYLVRSREPEEAGERLQRRGWHLTQEYSLAELPAPTTLFLRYERTSQEPPESAPEDEQDARIVAGFSMTLAGIFQLKAEWQHALKATAATREAPGYGRNVWLAQLVVVF